MQQPEVDAAAYLKRIGFDRPVTVDLQTLTDLQRAHLSTVPFENLDIVAGADVRTDLAWSLDKVVRRHRGGWCFEINGAFSALLTQLGFDVRLLGAAVLLDGPNELIDHLTLEVTLDKPYLVDVGFGDSFIVPLELNNTRPQNGGSGEFQFIASSQGTTLTRLDETDIPVPSYRFKRVNRTLDEFADASDRLRSDPALHWQQKPFATRLIDGGPDRVTLLGDRIATIVDGVRSESPVAKEDWSAVLAEHFGITHVPGSEPPDGRETTYARNAAKPQQ